MRKFILFIMLFSGSVQAHHLVYNKIRKLRPMLGRTQTRKIANSIEKWSRLTKVPKLLMTAIFMQESRFKLNVKSCHKNGCDYGMSQIWEVTARHYDFDLKMLTTDLDYSIGAGFIVMQDIMERWRKKEAYWWTRYNATTPWKRRRYRKLVQRFL